MRRIGVITGSRAEYGLLRPLLFSLMASETAEPLLIVTGAHLSREHGLTVREIREDAVPIASEISVDLQSDVDSTVARAFGNIAEGMSDVLARLKPDIVVVLGDRYEILAATATAFLLRIPVAHINGGDVTGGSLDDSMRHAIAKLAHLHFPTTADAAKRLQQLGEDPNQIYCVGSLALDVQNQVEKMDRTLLFAELGIEQSADVVLATFHSESNSSDSLPALDQLIAALDEFPQLQVIWTLSNADRQGLSINERLRAAAASHPNFHIFESLGSVRYTNLVRHADFVIGNSSSGVIEAPSLKTPTVNVGTRQDGRPRARSVVDTASKAEEIYSAIERVQSPEWRAANVDGSSPYGSPGTAEKICEVLSNVPLSELVKKEFRDTQVQST